MLQFDDVRHAFRKAEKAQERLTVLSRLDAVDITISDETYCIDPITLDAADPLFGMVRDHLRTRYEAELAEANAVLAQASIEPVPAIAPDDDTEEEAQAA
jgi:hypothetical protein